MRSDWQKFIRVGVIVACSFWLHTATAQTEIHKCTGPDGGIVYSQLPCMPQKDAAPEKTEPDEKTEIVQPISEELELSDNQDSQEEPKSAAARATCMKQYRDAIDVIDAEIGRDYSSEKSDQYKERLLVLTRQLRQC